MELRHRAAHAAALAVALVLAVPGAASAYTTAPGYQASDYATGFPESAANHWGPIGIAFDQSDNLYVADRPTATFTASSPAGVPPLTPPDSTQAPIPGLITGLVVSRGGDIYLARYGAGDIVQVDPGSGQVLRTVANVPCATGLAIDPASGDCLCPQDQCGSTIFRVSELLDRTWHRQRVHARAGRRRARVRLRERHAVRRERRPRAAGRRDPEPRRRARRQRSRRSRTRTGSRSERTRPASPRSWSPTATTAPSPAWTSRSDSCPQSRTSSPAAAAVTSRPSTRTAACTSPSPRASCGSADLVRGAGWSRRPKVRPRGSRSRSARA